MKAKNLKIWQNYGISTNGCNFWDTNFGKISMHFRNFRFTLHSWLISEIFGIICIREISVYSYFRKFCGYGKNFGCTSEFSCVFWEFWVIFRNSWCNSENFGWIFKILGTFQKFWEFLDHFGNFWCISKIKNSFCTSGNS